MTEAYLIEIQKKHLLPHGLVLHSRDLSLSPMQTSPPYAGEGLLQLRVWTWLPPPQVTVHAPQGPQSDQLPSTKKEESKTKKYEIRFLCQELQNRNEVWKTSPIFCYRFPYLYVTYNTVTWTRLVVAHSRFKVLSRTRISTKCCWGVGTGSCSALLASSTRDRTIVPVPPVRPITVDWRCVKQNYPCWLCLKGPTCHLSMRSLGGKV